MVKDKKQKATAKRSSQSHKRSSHKSQGQGHPNGMNPLPTDQQVIDFVIKNGGEVKRNNMLRYFKVHHQQRRDFYIMLERIEKAGGIALDKDTNTASLPQTLPRELVLSIDKLNAQGELFASPVAESLHHIHADIVVDDLLDLKIGDRIDAIITEIDPGKYIAKVRRKLRGTGAKPVLGTFQAAAGGGDKNTKGGHVYALDPDQIPRMYFLPADEAKELKDNKVVLVEPQPQEEAYQAPICHLIETVADDPVGTESLLAIHRHEIPHIFPESVIAESEALPAELSKKEIAEREDLRKIPLVTIDGADAKDFDDAVWAEKTKDGYHIIVAIADVAHYIEENGALDKEAIMRGNSTYFPDRVVPMLPERISNNLCSLRPKEDRPVLAVHIYINNDGEITSHNFVRGVIHSHARLTYEQVQDAIDGEITDVVKPVFESTVKPLYEVFEVLLEARQRRCALDLDVPERQILVSPDGKDITAKHRKRIDAHRVIEELMVLANVATGLTLSKKKAICSYRVHPEPSPEKLETLKGALQAYKINLSSTTSIKPQQMSNIAEKLRKLPNSDFLMTLLLRSQSQAYYSTENIGHFGLNLTHYAHFTSPIRRYSDLVVHRSLIKALKLPGKGALKADLSRVKSLAEHISTSERRSQQAEWEAIDRFVTRYYHERVGETFKASVVSVLKFGMFISIERGLGEGLIPMSLMGDDFYIFDPEAHTLTGRKSKQSFKVGDSVTVTLTEANQDVGQLTFALGKVSLDDVKRMGRGKKGRGGNRSYKGKGQKGQNKPKPDHGKGKRQKRTNRSK